MVNRLAQETSPYLLQHADNPVDWWAWGPPALDAARAADKPILLSVGYAACHWCHVMAHESFENPDVAGLMNSLFINIKVDREERPDIDTIYQSALAMLGQQGGWPLTMFLTPNAEPFWGGTYFPVTGRFGRPSFPDVLSALAETYRNQRDKVAKNVEALQAGLAKLAANRTGPTVQPRMLDRIADRLAQEIDPVWGGIGGAPKFPQTGILELLWRAWLRTGGEPYRHAVEVTLTRMCQGGIYDHLGGGFARYSTDSEWLAPHFEKMLYDNAQMIDVLSMVWQETRTPLYETRIRETVDWIAREMIAEGGGFASTLDADTEGEEGKFYVWTEAEIDAVLAPLGPQRITVFKQHYDVTPGGNWEDKTILNRRRQSGLADDETEAVLAEARRLLFDRRAGRVRPGWDDKVLADWNGLMIAALARAGVVFDAPAWIGMAERAFAFVVERMRVDGRLYHAWRRDQLRNRATLDDLAAMAGGALALFEATGRLTYLDQARQWVAEAEAHYADPEGGGFFLTADDADALIVRTKTVYDNAVPAGNGLMLGVYARLYHLTGDAHAAEQAVALMTAFSGEVERNIFPLSTFLNATELMRNATQVVVAEAAPGTGAPLVRAALGLSVPDRVLLQIGAATLPAGHPATDKGPVDGVAAAYVCRGLSCGLPLTEPAAVHQALKEARGAV